MRRTQKDKKFTSTQNAKWHGNEEQNEYLYLPYVTILWCPIWKLPEDRGKK